MNMSLTFHALVATPSCDRQTPAHAGGGNAVVSSQGYPSILTDDHQQHHKQRLHPCTSTLWHPCLGLMAHLCCWFYGISATWHLCALVLMVVLPYSTPAWGLWHFYLMAPLCLGAHRTSVIGWENRCAHQLFHFRTAVHNDFCTVLCCAA